MQPQTPRISRNSTTSATSGSQQQTTMAEAAACVPRRKQTQSRFGVCRFWNPFRLPIPTKLVQKIPRRWISDILPWVIPVTSGGQNNMLKIFTPLRRRRSAENGDHLLLSHRERRLAELGGCRKCLHSSLSSVCTPMDYLSSVMRMSVDRILSTSHLPLHCPKNSS